MVTVRRGSGPQVQLGLSGLAVDTTKKNRGLELRFSFTKAALPAALFCFLLCLLRRPLGSFLLCGFPGGLLRFLGRLFLGRGFLSWRFLFGRGLGRGLPCSATTAPGRSSRFGFGCGGRSRRHRRLAHLGFGHARFLLFFLFLFEIFFQRLAVSAGVTEFFFIITCVKRGIVERHCSS